jgi:HTH-type transcriptional regulator / antitoxin HipB
MRLTPPVLGLAIQKARKESGLTQDQLAKRARVSRKWLSALENGKPDVNLSLVLTVLAQLNYSLEITPGPRPPLSESKGKSAGQKSGERGSK